ncbi:MAG: ribosome recycling factor [candidate division KSB1 bacterium]|nr:ribosome recycling factor [candidate division KSB1 bacterium]
MIIDEIFQDAENRMKKAVEATQAELSKIRTGKASPAILDTIRVDYYGSSLPLKQVASISVPEPRLITIQPWDRKILPEIEKAILKSDLGLNPINDGNIIRLPIPPLTEERRRDLVRIVHKLGEEGRIAVRNIRRDANEQLKKAEKDGEISEDDAHRAMKEVQDLTDEYIEKIDEIIKAKEKEILEE